MLKKNQYLITVLFLLVISSLHAGNNDSLLKILNKQQSDDSNTVNLLYRIGQSYLEAADHSQALVFFHKSASLAHRLKYFLHEGNAYNKIGDIYYNEDQNSKAKEFYNKSLELFKEKNYYYHLALTYNDLGNLEESEGNYNAALKCFLNYLNFSEKIKSPKDIAIAYNNMAIIFADMGEFKKELAYNFKALKLREQMNDPAQLSASYNNIGVAYQNVDNYELAILYFTKALQLRKTINDAVGIAGCYHNLAICYKHKNDISLAEQYYFKALHMQDSLGIKSETILTRINLAKLYLETGNYNKAVTFLEDSRQLATELKLPSLEADAHQSLVDAYELLKNPSRAFFNYRKYIELRDSLNNIEQSKEFTRIEMQNQFDKELAERQSNQAKKDAILKQEQKQQRIITIAISLLLLIISIFLVFVYRNYKQKKQANIIITNQKKEVEGQKHLIEEKQKEIIDSINYAKRLQNAILASEGDIRIYFPTSFLYYKPKDIVAGDFYFFETTATHVFYAAADCTGHGVPGALVSVVCSNALSRCVKEFALTSPGEILDKTRELVLETFKKSAQDVKDGMDISLIAVEKNSVPGKNLKWAGANNPLWYASKENNGYSITEIKANKQPIGLTDSPIPFTTHHITLNPGDHIFLFTDGYADQFGGPNGKKFKYKQLERVILESCGLDSIRQKKHLETSFENWKGTNEQVDDVLLIGIKI